MQGPFLSNFGWKGNKLLALSDQWRFLLWGRRSSLSFVETTFTGVWGEVAGTGRKLSHKYVCQRSLAFNTVVLWHTGFDTDFRAGSSLQTTTRHHNPACEDISSGCKDILPTMKALYCQEKLCISWNVIYLETITLRKMSGILIVV